MLLTDQKMVFYLIRKCTKKYSEIIWISESKNKEVENIDKTINLS